LDDGLVVSVDVQRNFASRKQVSQTQLALIQIDTFDFLAFQKLQEVSSETSDQFVDDSGGGSLDFEGFIDGTGEFFIADSEFKFGFFFHGQFF
jgi:hypothetical protein